MDTGKLALGVVALAVGPTFGALDGGADLTVGPCNVEWFAPGTGALVFIGSLVLSVLRTHDDWPSRLGRHVAVFGFLLAAVVLWGGCRPKLVSTSDATAPIVIAWIGLLVAASRPPSLLFVQNARRAAIRLVPSLVAGWLMVVACDQFHARALEMRMGENQEASDRGDVLFIVVDTLRADALGAYGGRFAETPFLDGHARESALFEMALAQAAWTVPSMASMMSSFHPSTLEAQLGHRNPYSRVYRFPPGIPRLVDRFAAAGYRTAGYVKNPFLVEKSGFAEGFEVYQRVGGNAAQQESGEHLVRAILRWARVLAQRRLRGLQAPFFLYVHFMDPHISYLPPRRFMPDVSEYQGPFDGRSRTIVQHLRTGREATAEDKTFLRALYSADVEYVDCVVGSLHRELSRLGLWTDETTVVFTSDHGEQFGEHGGFLHRDAGNGGLHIESVRVPLMIRAPGIEAGRHPDPVRIIDIAPTVLELMELPPLPRAEGRSLVPLLRGDALPPLPVITQHHEGYRVTSATYAMIVDGDAVFLYDREKDPKETTDVSQRHPDVVKGLGAVLDQHLQREQSKATKATIGALPIDGKVRRALEAIGYVE